MKALPVILALGGLLFVSGSVEYAQAEEKPAVVVPTPLTKKVGEFYVSIGVFSISDLEKRFPRAYKLLVKYHGEPSQKDTHHLAVSVWRQTERGTEYLSDFQVEAEVRSPILRAVRKRLTKYPHQYSDNYGGWFDMSDRGLYHIAVMIKRGGEVKGGGL
ncbi:MAG: hypothetical protein Q9N26_07305 [Aquificota bacterium]|nr:hypothetical protein [Aquificota bacterium]